MMNEQNIRNAVKGVEMPADMRRRIVERCSRLETYARRSFVRTAVLAAVLVAFAGISVFAASNSGIFEDSVNWQGAIVGQRYVQATEDVILQVKEVSAEAGRRLLTVEIAFVNPDERPFNLIEEIDLGKYSISGADGELACEEKGTAKISNGKALIEIALDGGALSKGKTYSLAVESFYGLAKADQPLEIQGTWQTEFTVE